MGSWFQFTHPGGVRQIREIQFLGTIIVSIHAPGRGATYNHPVAQRRRYVSIHAPGRGATSPVIEASSLRGLFQFTHPGGVRQVATSSRCSTRWFQFTHPGGVRLKALLLLLLLPLLVSIHAPGRGATTASGSVIFSGNVSIHAPGRGATSIQLLTLITIIMVSIHAPGRGATYSTSFGSCPRSCFNSRTREGCDGIVPASEAVPTSFNSRTREGCDCSLDNAHV